MLETAKFTLMRFDSQQTEKRHSFKVLRHFSSVISKGVVDTFIDFYNCVYLQSEAEIQADFGAK